MTIRWILLFAALAAGGRAEPQCSWLNSGTAAGLLGAPIRSQKIAADGSACQFVSPSGELRILVEGAPASHAERCSGPAESLKAIGNEASSCAIESKDGKPAEQVAGRVRDRAFVIVVTSEDRGISRQVLKERARKAAEHVAGILF